MYRTSTRHRGGARPADRGASRRTPCAPVRALLPDGDIGAAYAVQSAWVTVQLAAGDSIAGRKIGLTNPAAQAQLGVDQPDFGTLVDIALDLTPGERR